MSWKEAKSPSVVSLEYSIPLVESYSIWYPSNRLREKDLGKGWAKSAVESRLADFLPVLSVVSKDGFNRHLLALSDVKTPVKLAFGAGHRSIGEEFRIDFFTRLISPIKEYETTLRIDTRPLQYSKAILQAREWYSSLGYELKVCPPAAKRALYSTWYSYFQDVTAADTLKEAKEAKKYGMEVVIVDDGWQMDEVTGDYSRVGDWIPSKKRFPSMRRFADKIHSIGMKVMLWFPVPYVGHDTKAYLKFKDYALRDSGKTMVLDPRYKVVRDYLIDTYEKALIDWDLDGLKLDFIDNFYANGNVGEGMDFVSVEDATEKLMHDVYAALTAIKPDVLIEFREAYVGPVVSAYGNMLRVGDCPVNPYMNFNDINTLRLIAGKCAVHSDMIRWNDKETARGVGVHLICAIFGVPQISVRMRELSPVHAAVLKEFLRFWNAHRETLLDGDFTVLGNDGRSSGAIASKDGETIIVSTLAHDFKVNERDARTYFFNISDSTDIIIRGGKGRFVQVFDPLGKPIYRKRKLRSELEVVVAPMSSRVEIFE